MKVKHIIDIAAFVAVLFGLIVLSSYYIKPRGYDAYDISGVKLKIESLKEEEKNSIDVMFAGNSESCYTCSPLQIWQEQGITSYCLGSGAQRLCDTYAILYESYKYQSPKIVVLETDSLFEEYPGIYKDNNTFNNKAEETFPILHYHSFYNQIQLPQFILKYTNNRKNEKIYKGFQVRETTQGCNNTDYMEKTDEVAPISEDGKHYLSKIKGLCESHKSKFILISAPSVQNWNYAKHNAASQWAEEHKISYLDLNTINDKLNINWKTDTFDGGVHVNIDGSEKISKYVGDFLARKENCQKHDDEKVNKKWHNAYKKSKYSEGEQK